MPYAITLRLDRATAAIIEAMWHALAAEGGGEPPGHGYPPHLTLALCPDGMAAEDLRVAAAAVACGWDALLIDLAGFGLFPGGPPILWAAPVATAALLARHAALPPAAWHPHYRPGAWVPHVTLSDDGRLPPARAMGIVTRLWRGPVAGRAERLELVRFPPAAVLWSQDLARGDGGATAAASPRR